MIYMTVEQIVLSKQQYVHGQIKVLLFTRM